jgi:probable F420-dependent oxidoreductase
MDQRATAEQLGRVGVWLSRIGRLSADDERKTITEIERLGYRTLWVNESFKEVFAHAGLALAASQRLVVATGIASIWTRRPAAMATGANALGEAYPGRFVLGIGVSHPRLVTGYDRPLAAMRDYLDGMDAAAYPAPLPTPPVPRLLAALRPKMLDLAATRAAGAHPYLVPVEHTAVAREAMGPEPVLAPELAVVLDTDPASARAAARDYLRLYLGLPNYTGNLRVLGFTDDDFAGGGSDRLVDAIVAWGDVDAVRLRVREHLDAGADHVCIQPVPAGGSVGLDTLADLAPALLV